MDKNAAMAQAEKTSNKAKLADRLISGLSGEFQRWTITIKELTEAEGRQFSLACSYDSLRDYLASCLQDPDRATLIFSVGSSLFACLLISFADPYSVSLCVVHVLMPSL